MNAQSAIKNSAYNFIGYLWPMVFAIFVTPIVVFKLGTHDYGVYVMINSILSLLGLLDLGVGMSTIKHIAQYLATKENLRLERLVYSMNSIYIIIGLVGFICFVLFGIFANFFSIGGLIGNRNYFWLFLIAGVTFFINSISSLFNLSFSAMQRYDLGLKIGMTSLTLSSLAILLLVLLNYGILEILLLQSVVALLTFFFLLKQSHRVHNVFSFKFAWDKIEIINCYRYGISAFLSNLAGSSLTYLDRMIIPLFLGPTQLTYYSLPGNITSKITGISNSLSGVLFPVAVSFHATNNRDKLVRVYKRSFRLLAVVAAAISFSIILMADKILLYWLNEDFSNRATGVLIILTLTNYFLALLGPLTNFLLAIGKTRFLSLSSLVMAMINGLLLVLLIPKFGILGASWAYLLAVIPVFYMFYYVEKNFLGINILKNHLILYGKILVVLLPFYFIQKFLLYPLVDSLVGLMIFGPFSVLLFLVIYGLFNFFEADDLADFYLFLSKVLNKLFHVLSRS